MQGEILQNISGTGMKLIKIIYQYLICFLKKNDNLQYFDNPPENLSMSDIKLDMRNPVCGRKYISIGKDSAVSATCVFETDSGFIKIADRVFIGGGSFICRSSIQIDENVQIAWGCLMYDHNAHSFDYQKRRKDIDVFLVNKKAGRDVLKNEGKDWSVVHSAPIHVCHDAWIGANVTILNGVTIGEGAIIGAGSIVRNDIPAWSIAVGNPAVVIGMNKYKE